MIRAGSAIPVPIPAEGEGVSGIWGEKPGVALEGQKGCGCLGGLELLRCGVLV